MAKRIFIAVLALMLAIGPHAPVAAADPVVTLTVYSCQPGFSGFPAPPDPYTVKFLVAITGLAPGTSVGSVLTVDPLAGQFGGFTQTSGFGSGLDGTASTVHGPFVTSGAPIGLTATTIVSTYSGPGDPGTVIATLSVTVTSCEAPPPAAPVTTADCKNDGWKQYTALGFKNQGDCVSYVATKGKNQPSN